MDFQANSFLIDFSIFLTNAIREWKELFLCQLLRTSEFAYFIIKICGSVQSLSYDAD